MFSLRRVFARAAERRRWRERRSGSGAVAELRKPRAVHTCTCKNMARVMRRPSASAAVAAAALALSGSSTASAFVVSGPSRAGIRSEVSVKV